MSIYTTRKMTKEQVVALIQQELPKMDSSTLERLGDILLEPALYNCVIVPEGFED